ncbi:MAG: uracil-DNA glycosylase family protein [Rhodobacteraceae bacterium]|nr:uracil-DNA glycosylase family protein [Paracoccaceae bacterium]
MRDLISAIRSCDLCRDRFAKTHTAHQPRPVVWLSPTAPILISGQAPGARVHASGRPFTDPSGDRLRDWLGLSEETFYDRDRIAIMPLAFCFPGYNAKGHDLPPPAVCARTWHGKAMAQMQGIRLKILVGGYAQKWHLNTRKSVTETVKAWRDCSEDTIPLPHPSWRNTAWLKANPWFEAELLPVLRQRIQDTLNTTSPQG